MSAITRGNSEEWLRYFNWVSSLVFVGWLEDVGNREATEVPDVLVRLPLRMHVLV